MMSESRSLPTPQGSGQYPVVESSSNVVSGEMQVPRDILGTSDREVGAIVADVWENAEKLVRQELELGLAELDRRVDKLKIGLAAAAVGGAVLYAGVLTLVAALVLGLAEVMSPWIAALAVGLVITGIGAAMGKGGSSKTAESAKPDEHLHRTVRAMKEAVK